MNTKPPFLRFLRPSSPAPLLGLSAWALTFAAAGLPTSLSAQPPPVVQAQASSAADARLTPDQLDELKPFQPHHHDLLGDLFNLVVGGFLEGVADKPSEEETKIRKELEAKLAELTAKLEAFQSETDETEVVLELKKPAPRRKQ